MFKTILIKLMETLRSASLYYDTKHTFKLLSSDKNESTNDDKATSKESTNSD